MANWTDTFDTSPPESQDHGRGGERIRETRAETRARMMPEHNVGVSPFTTAPAGTNYTDDGRHNPGSARGFTGAVSPTQLLRPDGGGAAVGPTAFAAALGANDTGRVWVDESGGVPVARWWTGSRWAGVRGVSNALINGSMLVWQRGATHTLTIATERYCADRWVALAAGGVGAPTVTRVASAFASLPRSTFVSRLTGAAGVTNFRYSQRVESAHIAPFLVDVGFVTFSCRIRNNTGAPINPNFEVYTADAVDDFTPSTLRAGPTAIPAIAAATDAYYSVAFDLNALANAANGVQFTVDMGAITGASVDIGEVMVEPGQGRSPFWERTFVEELADCQRYYEKTFNYATAPAQNAGVAGSLMSLSSGRNAINRDLVVNWNFAVEKRDATYTVTYYNPSAANTQWQNLTTGGSPASSGDHTIGANDMRGTRSLPFSNAAAIAASTDEMHAIHVSVDNEL